MMAGGALLAWTTVVLVFLPLFVFFRFVETKWVADLQARVGPNRTGAAGLGQSLADGIKLLQKSDPTSTQEFWNWRLVEFCLMFGTVLLTPILPFSWRLDSEVSVFFAVGSSLIYPVLMLFSGIRSGSPDDFLLGLRSAGHVLTGLVPVVVGLLTAGLVMASFRWSHILEAQGFSPLEWTLFSHPPFLVLSGFSFYLGTLLIFGLPPFEWSSEFDLHCQPEGFWGGPGQVLTAFQRFYIFLMVATLTVGLFLGGGRLPEWMGVQVGSSLEGVVLMAKSLMLMMGTRLLTAIFPRLRVEQMTDFSWWILTPLSLLGLIGTVIWMAQ